MTELLPAGPARKHPARQPDGERALGGPVAPTETPEERCLAVLAQHSRSFDLASRLLPRGARVEAAAVYAWCRSADDAVDGPAPHLALALPGPAAPTTLGQGPPAARAPMDALAVVAHERARLAAVYATPDHDDPALAAFAAVVRRRGIPLEYPAALLDGMEMDALGQRYHTDEQLDLYCYRVASTVGLMMCHVLGVRRRQALGHAADLGHAMQLTNIARDVREDWERGRLYLPDTLLRRHGLGGLADALGGPFPVEARRGLAEATRALLHRAAPLYASGDAGLPDLPARAALGVHAARLVYSAIGARVLAQGCDPLAPRAVVSAPRKLALLFRAGLTSLGSAPGRLLRPFTPVTLDTVLEFSP